jgi:trehalose 2-sulfotransferase
VLENITRSFTIAFTMRSGSNAICDLLARNGLGEPGEWFQKPLSSTGNETWLDAFTRLIEEHQVDGVFGSKMSHDHRAALDERLRNAIPGYRCLDDVLPGHRWVRLIRKDKVLQAISLCRAESSGEWALTEPDRRQSSEFDYDFFHVLSRLMGILAGEFAWDLYFQQQGLDPLLIVYEDFFQDLNRQLPRLIEYLGGLPPGRTSLEMSTTFKIQRDELNDPLRERFVSDLNRVGDPSLAKEIGAPWDRWTRFYSERQWRS